MNASPRPTFAARDLPVVLGSLCALCLSACEPVGPPPFPAASPVTVVGPQRLTGLRAKDPLQFTFSVPMDAAETAKGLSFEPPVAFAATWPNDHTMTVVPVDGFEYAEVTDPAAPAKSYAFTLRARSQTGAELSPPLQGAITTLRRLQIALMSDPALDGYVRSDGEGTGSATCTDYTMPTAAKWEPICVGESKTKDGTGRYLRYRGLLSFPLAALPQTVAEIEKASVALYLFDSGGGPFDDLGTINLETAAFNTPLTIGTFNAGAEVLQKAFCASEAKQWYKSTSSPELVQWVSQGRSLDVPRAQFRLSFTGAREPTSPHVGAETVKFIPGGAATDDDPERRPLAPRLELTVLLP